MDDFGFIWYKKGSLKGMIPFGGTTSDDKLTHWKHKLDKSLEVAKWFIPGRGVLVELF